MRGIEYKPKEDEYKYDERPTKHFFNKEKKRGQQKQTQYSTGRRQHRN